jgi:dihydrofolate reductase
MRKLVVFNNISLDGYFTDAKNDMSWAHSEDAEWDAFTAENAQGGGALVLGRITYELMIQFWPTPYAAEIAPVVAERMNAMPKFVFSHTLDKAAWNNTTLLRGNLASEINRLKQEPGDKLTILGSGSLVSQLTRERLIDEYQFVLTPVVLGQGRTMFDGAPERLLFNRTHSRSFGNGNVLLCYEPEIPLKGA